MMKVRKKVHTARKIFKKSKNEENAVKINGNSSRVQPEYEEATQVINENRKHFDGLLHNCKYLFTGRKHQQCSTFQPFINNDRPCSNGKTKYGRNGSTSENYATRMEAIKCGCCPTSKDGRSQNPFRPRATKMDLRNRYFCPYQNTKSGSKELCKKVDGQYEINIWTNFCYCSLAELGQEWPNIRHSQY